MQKIALERRDKQTNKQTDDEARIKFKKANLRKISELVRNNDENFQFLWQSAKKNEMSALKTKQDKQNA